MAKPAFTAEDVRMIVADGRQLALVRQARAKILGMLTWNEEQGYWTIDPAWQGWIDATVELRQQMSHTDRVADQALPPKNTDVVA